MELYNCLYMTTELEDWVSTFYKRMGILKPKQIKIDAIARENEIFFRRKPVPSYHQVIGRFRGITIDSRVSKDLQREMFFHELCHVLRHSGSQMKMPHAFRELQEWDARRFTLYAAIPHHMLKGLNLDDPYVVDYMVSLFKVTPELCKERLGQVRNRCMNKVAESRYTYKT